MAQNIISIFVRAWQMPDFSFKDYSRARFHICRPMCLNKTPNADLVLKWCHGIKAVYDLYFTNKSLVTLKPIILWSLSYLILSQQWNTG